MISKSLQHSTKAPRQTSRASAAALSEDEELAAAASRLSMKSGETDLAGDTQSVAGSVKSSVRSYPAVSTPSEVPNRQPTGIEVRELVTADPPKVCDAFYDVTGGTSAVEWDTMTSIRLVADPGWTWERDRASEPREAKE